MEQTPLAHSAPHPGAAPQIYADHVAGVMHGARRRAEETVALCRDPELATRFVEAVVAAAAYHDLGKLDNDMQAVLRAGPGARPNWDHIDAGVAYLMARSPERDEAAAAWLVRGHHAPGLPRWMQHFLPRAQNSRYLRGCRRDGADVEVEQHERQKLRTDRSLARLLERHDVACGAHRLPDPGEPMHGLALRLMLSCLVDADHADTAAFVRGWREPPSLAPRWAERLDHLDAYVAGLHDRGGERDEQRRAFYALCRNVFSVEEALTACEGPVGIGKTTAVTAWLLRRAIATGARRLFVVAPFTNILAQTAQRLREALTLPDECPDQVVAEHHHRADFTDPSTRDLATLWNAPVVLTTAVQFFETLASNHPGRLRKLHGLPGSVIFLDEAHAALPTPLWAQNWRWLQELTDAWGCSATLASGSLARFWEIPEVVGAERVATLPVLNDEAQTHQQRALERARVKFASLGLLETPAELTVRVVAEPGPRLLIVNTVQSAAVMARLMREQGHDVLHLSSALSPHDRANVLRQVQERLHDADASNWTLVATSLVEAGVDLSFRRGFRERFSTASLLQVAGRVNRNSEFGDACVVYDFELCTTGGIVRHPMASHPAHVLGKLLREGRFSQKEIDPSALVSDALCRELWLITAQSGNKAAMVKAEAAKDYPEVAMLGHVITDDTVMVVVEAELRECLATGERVTPRELLNGSVRMRDDKRNSYCLEEIPGRRGIYAWPHAYDPGFLGYMAGVLEQSLPASDSIGAE